MGEIEEMKTLKELKTELNLEVNFLLDYSIRGRLPPQTNYYSFDKSMKYNLSAELIHHVRHGIVKEMKKASLLENDLVHI